LHKLVDGGSTAEEPKNMPITDYSRYLFKKIDQKGSNIKVSFLELAYHIVKQKIRTIMKT